MQLLRYAGCRELKWFFGARVNFPEDRISRTVLPAVGSQWPVLLAASVHLRECERGELLAAQQPVLCDRNYASEWGRRWWHVDT